MVTVPAIALVIGYLLGSLPFGYLVARAHGVDIFNTGSGSPGATNIRRSVGAGASNLVFALDALKGAIAAGLPLILPHEAAGDRTVTTQLSGLVGALLGHSFSCFTRFRGGKGVATGAGGLLVMVPVATLIGAVAWIVTFYSSRFVSLASMVAAVTLPLAAWGLGRSPLLVGFTSLIAVFVLIRHRENIRRLVAGKENRFTRRSGPSSGP